jgi:monovalent cation:H+ antiporter, CPA1 family
MRELLESYVLVFGVGAAVAIFAKRIGTPYNVALVVIGLLLVLTNVLPHTPMDPQVVLVALLPVLVFEAALFADVDGLREASRPILTLALPGVAISLVGTASVATFVLEMPFSVALLLGALLSITDTVSVLLAFRSIRVPHRLAAIMEGESLFNDGTALVLVSITTTIVAAGHSDFSLASFGASFSSMARAMLYAILGGVATGAIFGIAFSAALRKTPDHLTAILTSGVLVFATSLLAERIHASPVIAVVVAGMVVGRSARRTLEPSHVLALQGFWEAIGFGINVLLFALVGMQIDARMFVTEAGSILAAVLALHVGRAIAVYGCFAVPGILRAQALRTETVRRRDDIPLRWQHVMVFGNIKGALSMAAALALPADLPYRARIITIVFGVTFITLLTQALPFRRFLRTMKVAQGTDDVFDAARARLIAARRGQAELDSMLSTGLLSRAEHAERRAVFQRTIIEAETKLRTPEADAADDLIIDGAVLSAQKAALLDAARRGLVATETAEKEIGQIDRRLHELPKEVHSS